MSTMQGFYISITSAPQPQGSYLAALSAITSINLRQITALQSDLGWQDWSEQNQKAATRAA